MGRSHESLDWQLLTHTMSPFTSPVSARTLNPSPSTP